MGAQIMSLSGLEHLTPDIQTLASEMTASGWTVTYDSARKELAMIREDITIRTDCRCVRPSVTLEAPGVEMVRYAKPLWSNDDKREAAESWIREFVAHTEKR